LGITTSGTISDRTVLRYAADTTASPAEAWSLLARPERWPEWAPQLRGAWGLAGPSGEVEPGRTGAARLLGVVPVPARITLVDPGRAWTWRVGPVTFDHLVEPRTGGCTVATTIRTATPLEAALSVTYGPVVALLMRNLARVAAR
jgi:hypothetical protein